MTWTCAQSLPRPAWSPWATSGRTPPASGKPTRSSRSVWHPLLWCWDSARAAPGESPVSPAWVAWSGPTCPALGNLGQVLRSWWCGWWMQWSCLWWGCWWFWNELPECCHRYCYCCLKPRKGKKEIRILVLQILLRYSFWSMAKFLFIMFLLEIDGRAISRSTVISCFDIMD